MFNQTFINAEQDGNRPYTIVLSLLLQIVVMCIVILIPLIYSEALPSPQLKSTLVAPAPPLSPAPPKLAATTAESRAARHFVAPATDRG
jgi:hypothetical protein